MFDRSFFPFFLNELKHEKARERSRNTRDKISRLVLIDSSKAVCVHKKGQKKKFKERILTREFRRVRFWCNLTRREKEQKKNKKTKKKQKKFRDPKKIQKKLRRICTTQRREKTEKKLKKKKSVGNKHTRVVLI